MNLSDEQYQTLLKEENAFDTLIHHGYCKNLQHPFLQQLKQVFAETFNEAPLNINCAACISSAMHKLWPLMEAKKFELVKRKEDELIAETIKKRDQVTKHLFKK